MFAIDEIKAVTESLAFHEDYSIVRSILSKERIGQRDLFQEDAADRLGYFVESVLASAPVWNGADSQGSAELCRTAAEVSEVLALGVENSSEDARRRARLRSALLYELADQPALASAVLLPDDLPELLFNFFARQGAFG